MAGIERAMAGSVFYLAPRSELYHNGVSEVYFVPLKNEKGEVYAVLNILHDVSEMHAAQSALETLNKTLEQKNKELESKNEEIASFAFVASHDLKEPLRKIHTFSDWLLTKETDNLSSMGKTYLDRINCSVKRLDALIADILAITQIHSEKSRHESVDLNETLRAAKDSLKELISAKKASIQSEKLPMLQGSPHQLELLFMNLLSNALRFQSEGSIPQIAISSEIINSKNLPEKTLTKADYVRLSFGDNGIGIAARHRQKIFEIFQRLHTQEYRDGTGIGLTICRKIMENHGGIITVDSEEGKGSVFHCFFPVSHT